VQKRGPNGGWEKNGVIEVAGISRGPAVRGKKKKKLACGKGRPGKGGRELEGEEENKNHNDKERDMFYGPK